MSDSRTNELLIAAHVVSNLGIYFDGVDQLTSSLSYVYSEKIEDGYWNYGYRRDGSALSEAELARVLQQAILRGRDPVVFQIVDAPTPVGWRQISEEVWMTAPLTGADASELARPSVRVHDTPSQEMVVAFEDAYGADEDGVGYTALPSEYGQTYREGAARIPAQSAVVEIRNGDNTVAVASVSVVGDLAGLYSVGTPPQYRRNGYGRLASAAALAVAASRGASLAFLQTEPNSVVEEMYRSIGFTAQFRGQLLGPS